MYTRRVQETEKRERSADNRVKCVRHGEGHSDIFQVEMKCEKPTYAIDTVPRSP